MDELDVLLVDDSIADADLIRAMLEDTMRIDHVETLASARAHLADPARRRTSLVLLDLCLPDSFGVDTYDRMAAESPCPIVVLTGDDDADQARTLLARGARGYVVKGEVDGARLRSLIKEVVEDARSGGAKRLSGDRR